MFTKKYVGPVDCASCEKGIVNLNGMRAENIAWNRLPFREPNERIARVSSLLKTVFLVWPRIQQISRRSKSDGESNADIPKLGPAKLRRAK